MSHDNPFARFSAFFWGVVTFFLFAGIIGVMWVMAKLNEDEKPSSLEEAAGVKRYEARAKIDAAQDAAFHYKEVEAGKKVQVPPHEVFEHVGKQLISTKAAAVEKNEQIVPGSPTAKKLAEAPATVDYTTVNAMGPKAGDPIDPAVMEKGKAQYLMCAACHGQNGEGGPAGPPHAGAEWVTGPVSNLILIQLRGLQGPITVKGQPFAGAPIMAPMAFQTDEQIANVLTYVRNSFGNQASAVSPEQVKALRGEAGKPMLRAEELIQP
jgi:mono/diheme cytochrome c family protein